MKIMGALTGLAVAIASVMPANAQEQLAGKLVNAPGAVSGWGGDVKVRADEGVQGGKAVRIVTTGKEAHVWEVGVYTPVTKVVASGHRLVLAFWARLEKGPGGAGSSVLPVNAIQMSAPPNLPIVKGEVTITSEWKLYQIAGAAPQDFAAGELSAALQLGGQDQIVDVGPIYVFDLDRKGAR